MSQLGNCSTKSESIPIQIKALDKFKIIKIAAGNAHSMFLDNKNRVFLCGETFGYSFPILLKTNTKAIDISCGSDNSIVVSEKGNLLGIGKNKYGEIMTEEQNVKELTKIKAIQVEITYDHLKNSFSFKKNYYA